MLPVWVMHEVENGERSIAMFRLVGKYLESMVGRCIWLREDMSAIKLMCSILSYVVGELKCNSKVLGVRNGLRHLQSLWSSAGYP
jgi:hypothetical protein